MQWLTLIVPILLTSAVVSGLVAGGFNQLSLRTQYKNAYYKIVLDSRVQAYVLLSTLLGQCSSLVRGDDNLAFFLPFVSEAALDGFNEIRRRVDAERLWFSDTALSALHELDTVMIRVPDGPSAILQFGKDNAGRFTDILSNLRNAHAADMLTLYDIPAFLKRKIREGRAPREVEAPEITKEVISASDSNQAIHQDELGDAALEVGDLEVARTCYRNALAIRERLNSTDPESAEWWHDLAVSHLKLGNVTIRLRHLGEARNFYCTAYDTLRRLVAEDPASAWERSLAVACLVLLTWRRKTISPRQECDNLRLSRFDRAYSPLRQMIQGAARPIDLA